MLWKRHEYQHSADIFVKNFLTHFMALVPFYNRWNHQKIRCLKIWDVSKPHIEETSAMKWVKSHLIFTYWFSYLHKQLKIVHTTEMLPTKWKSQFFSSNFHEEFISYNFDKIAVVLIKLFFIIFNNSGGFFLQFEACIIYCFYS